MAEIDIWCDGECNTHPEGSANYHDDGNQKVYTDKEGQTYICSKHHWSCSECDKIVQVG